MKNLEEVQGKLLVFETKEVENQKGEKVTKHFFVFNTNVGIVEVTIASEDYLETQLKRNEVETLEEWVKKLEQEETTLYWNSSENFSGYSFHKGFAKNYFPKLVGDKVRIIDVVDNNQSIELYLEDETVAVRKFMREIKDQFVFDIQKRMRFLQSMGLNPLTDEVDKLIGARVTYSIKKLGKAQYFEPAEVIFPLPSDFPSTDELEEEFDFLSK